jgi:hypothetical protein
VVEQSPLQLFGQGDGLTRNLADPIGQRITLRASHRQASDLGVEGRQLLPQFSQDEWLGDHSTVARPSLQAIEKIKIGGTPDLWGWWAEASAQVRSAGRLWAARQEGDPAGIPSGVIA